MEVIDHFLSKKKFTVQPSSRCGVLETSPKPSSKDLPRYYKSEEYLSHNKNDSFLSKLYFLAKRVNFFLKLNTLRKHSSSLNRLLDFGSGDGFFITELNKNRISAYGYEPFFNSKTPKTYKQKELLLRFDKAYFDVITMWHSLEHVKSYSETITFLKPLIKSNGLLVIACPNFQSWEAKYYKGFWAGYDVPRHLWHFSANGLVGYLEQNGFVLIKQKPMYMDSFYVCMLSEKYKGSKLWFLKGLFVGLYSNFVSFFTKSFSSTMYIFQKSNLSEFKSE